MHNITSTEQNPSASAAAYFWEMLGAAVIYYGYFSYFVNQSNMLTSFALSHGKRISQFFSTITGAFMQKVRANQEESKVQPGALTHQTETSGQTLSTATGSRMTSSLHPFPDQSGETGQGNAPNVLDAAQNYASLPPAQTTVGPTFKFTASNEQR